MGGAPVLETIRPGVVFTPPAAASFRRAEHDLGRRIDVNSSTRDWDLQMSMYLAWQAWVNGTGPKPWHARAVHPKYSKHCTGLAVDSDDWTRPGFNAFMAERGWIRVAAYDPTEQHHFEYQWWRDQHRNRPAPAGTIEPIPVIEPEEEDEPMKYGQIHTTRPDGKMLRRALYAPGTPYFVFWDGNDAALANALATQFETGSSVEVSYGVFEAFQKAAADCAG